VPPWRREKMRIGNLSEVGWRQSLHQQHRCVRWTCRRHPLDLRITRRGRSVLITTTHDSRDDPSNAEVEPAEKEPPGPGGSLPRSGRAKRSLSKMRCRIPWRKGARLSLAAFDCWSAACCARLSSAVQLLALSSYSLWCSVSMLCRLM
jgi:hypothetical protein